MKYKSVPFAVVAAADHYSVVCGSRTVCLLVAGQLVAVWAALASSGNRKTLILGLMAFELITCKWKIIGIS